MNINDIKTYELIQEKEIPAIASKGYVLRHKKSGARVLLMENDDTNKVFSIGFRTPAPNSTGIAHIMEHSVLCGSKNFPSKDPFVALVKGSLNTFLNAMTYPDKTVYPVASTNDKDFQNLMHVYLDAVFYPNIYEHDEIFRQEGWSYKLTNKDDELTYNGVVYNEMKGAFSSPEGVLDRVIQNTLFPDTTYANESGGDPDVIPELSYEEFLDFHRTYYHPSNSYIYLYGDMDFEEKLRFIDEMYLKDFDKINPNSDVKYQKPFNKMIEKEMPYSIAKDEDTKDKTYLSYNKVIGDALDSETYLAFQILDYVLLGSPGAILKKALIEEGIGNDILGGYDNGILQPMFSVIAKEANLSDKEHFIRIIESTINDVIKNKIDRTALEAGINYFEFRYREADFGGYPKGLMYGLQIFDSWLYDDDKVFIHVDAADTFKKLRDYLNTNYYEDLLKKYIINNNHGAYVNVIPDQGRTIRVDQELAKKLQQYKDSLSDAEIEKLVSETKELEDYQNEQDSEEALNSIPTLEREDIRKEIEPIVNEELIVDGVRTVYHEINTNGIAYLDLLFKIDEIDEDKLVYLSILQAVLGMIDTDNYTYGELSDAINVHTGGIGTDLDTYANVDDIGGEFLKTFEFKAKALYNKVPIIFDMISEIILRSKLDDAKRLKEIISMITSRLLMKFQQSGHSTAVLRATSYTSSLASYKDKTSGIDYYYEMVKLRDNFDNEKENIIRNIKELSNYIFRKENIIVSFTSEKEGISHLKSVIGKFSDGLFTSEYAQMKYIPKLAVKNEGFKTASKVQYVATCGNFIESGMQYTGALQILRVILSYEYLWKNLRVKGGAYGCMSGFNRIGEGFFVSYRDPHLKNTLEVFKGIPEYVKNFDADEEELTKYIIGTISGLDHPLTPSAKGDRSMNLLLGNITKDELQNERNQILTATPSDIRRLHTIIDKILDANKLCVVGSEEKIESNKDIFTEVKGF
ncbi:MAG: insulinase family protein [Suipraeoptans sp.]